MGCSQSTEAAVPNHSTVNNSHDAAATSAATANRSTANTSVPTSSSSNQAKAAEAPPREASTTASVASHGGESSHGSRTTGAGTSASPPSASGGSGYSTPPSGSPIGTRGRFLSYASGASTPNTSSGSSGGLSWDGSSDLLQEVGVPKGGESSSGAGDGEKKRKNPKALKHSGSAIGLDEVKKEGAGLSTKVVHIEVPFGKPIEEVYDGVHDGPVLGSGVSGLVRLVKHKATGVKYAVKCLDLGLVGTKEGLEQLREEIFIMCQLDHPNIVRLEEVYESHSEIYLVQELCLGGELFDRLDEQPDYHYTESECARLVKQMLSAVRYLHSKGIIHRDLKLENFLFSSTATDSELKMIDFGLSKHFRFGEVHHEAVGTPYTVAPEVIRGTYDERCDIWAIGVITFLLLSGDPPFGGCGGPEPLLTVRSNILNGAYSFDPEEVWDLVSGRAKEFIRALLVIDPKQRPTARDAQKHPWLREWASRQRKQDDNVLNPNVVKALVTFKEFSDMRKLLCEVLSFTLLPDQIKELRKEFEKMDTDGSGEISLSALKQVLLTNAGAGSLGGLTEEEVEDIFNAMRVKKTETRIHWHEFIAAGLSQCQVDDRNLRLAFDRLDGDHKGYITLEDIMNLVGQDEVHSEETMRKMWMESMRSVNCNQARITYDNFLLLMKGQTKEPEPDQTPPRSVPNGMKGPNPRHTNLGALPEGEQLEDEEGLQDVSPTVALSKASPSLGAHIGNDEKEDFRLDTKNADEVSLHSLPNISDTQDMNESGNSSSDLVASGREEEKQSPVVRKVTIKIPEPQPVGLELEDSADSPEVLRRPRSQSLSEKNIEEPKEESAYFGADSRRALALPEHDNNLDTALSKNKSVLAVNRQLIRAHRQMRLSVMEASRRFEEQQARRARDTLIARKEAEGLAVVQAGLVMRHGHKVQVTSEAIRNLLETNRAEQQKLVAKANKRGGRGRASRKKTISDMSGMMMSSLGQDELGMISRAASKTPESTRETMFHDSLILGSLDMPKLEEAAAEKAVLEPRVSTNAPNGNQLPVPVVDKEILRGATVPGEFRKTADPFSLDGMYGGSRFTTAAVNDIRSDSTSK